MAINKSNANEQVTVEFKLHTGLCNMSIVAINPSTADQIEALGYRKPQADPEYLSINSETGAKKIRLDIYLENKTMNIRTKMALWLENTERISQTGKNEWINNQAQSCYAEQADVYDWFDHTTARKALVGETTLHDFIKVWANVGTKADANGVIPECKLENINAIFDKDFSELQGLVRDLSEYEVKILLGVRQVDSTDENQMPKVSNYQDVYTKMFARSYQKSYNVWLKKLGDEYGAYKQNYQDSLELQEFNPSSTPTPNAGTPSTDETPF